MRDVLHLTGVPEFRAIPCCHWDSDRPGTAQDRPKGKPTVAQLSRTRGLAGLVVELEADPSGKQRDDQVVEGHALFGGARRELLMQRRRHPNDGLPTGGHRSDSTAYGIDIASTACDTRSMPRISFTQREVNVARDALQRLTAYTDEELRDFLDWDDADKDAWSDALDKFTAAADTSSEGR